MNTGEGYTDPSCVVCKTPSTRPFCADCLARANREVDAEERSPADARSGGVR